jgi:hypothetical protein
VTVLPVPMAKRYARAGMIIYDHCGDGMVIYGDMVRCKRCGAVLLGTDYLLHDHWHDMHESDFNWHDFYDE